jgi:hypothetical protein
VDTVVAPNTNVARKGVVIKLVVNLGHGLGRFSTRKSLSRSSRLPMMNIGVVGTSQMVFINPIIITHVHRTTNRPSMSSIAIRGYISIDVEDPKGGHQEPFVITQGIFDHRNRHFCEAKHGRSLVFRFKKRC